MNRRRKQPEFRDVWHRHTVREFVYRVSAWAAGDGMSGERSLARAVEQGGGSWSQVRDIAEMIHRTPGVRGRERRDFATALACDATGMKLPPAWRRRLPGVATHKVTTGRMGLSSFPSRRRKTSGGFSVIPSGMGLSGREMFPPGPTILCER